MTDDVISRPSNRNVPFAFDRLRNRRMIDEKGCHRWLGALNTSGYATIRLDGKLRLAHVVAWELDHGRKPIGVDCHHVCERKDCINPRHLLALTKSEHKRLHLAQKAGA